MNDTVGIFFLHLCGLPGWIYFLTSIAEQPLISKALQLRSGESFSSVESWDKTNISKRGQFLNFYQKILDIPLNVILYYGLISTSTKPQHAGTALTVVQNTSCWVMVYHVIRQRSVKTLGCDFKTLPQHEDLVGPPQGIWELQTQVTIWDLLTRVWTLV